MKNLIWIVIAGVIALGAYMLYSGRSVQEIATDASDAVNAPAALESATEAVGDAVEATEGAVTERGRGGRGCHERGQADRRGCNASGE